MREFFTGMAKGVGIALGAWAALEYFLWLSAADTLNICFGVCP